MWGHIGAVAFRLLALMQRQPLNQMAYTRGKKSHQAAEESLSLGQLGGLCRQLTSRASALWLQWLSKQKLRRGRSSARLRFGSALKRLQQTVRQLRRRKQLSAHTMYSGDIVLLISTEDIVRGWKESFTNCSAFYINYLLTGSKHKRWACFTALICDSITSLRFLKLLEAKHLWGLCLAICSVWVLISPDVQMVAHSTSVILCYTSAK